LSSVRDNPQVRFSSSFLKVFVGRFYILLLTSKYLQKGFRDFFVMTVERFH